MSVNFGNIPCTITAIGEKAFMSCSDLTEVRIPSSVTRIKDYAFDGCTSLAKVNIPSTVTVINRYVFRNCTSLTSVTIPSSVTAIYPAAFDGCTSLASFPIPNSVTSIGAYAFRNCHPSSPSITISSSVTQIESEAFYGCGFLAVTLNSNDVVSLDYNEGAFCSIFGDQVERYIIGSNVTKIGNSAFKGCTGLTSVTIPGSVTQIGTHAFEGCTGLSSVTIPGSVTQIGNNAFQDCTGLTSIFLNNGLEELGYAAFRNCIGLTSVSLPNSLTEIGSYAFDGCTGLTSVSISGSVTEIGYNAFQNCTGLSSVTIPSSVQTIGNKVFEGCSNLTSVTINSNAVASAEYSGPGSYSGKNFKTIFGNQVTSYTFGPSVTAIGTDALEGCTGMTEVTFSNSLTSIGMNAFRNCIGLTSVSFPNSLNSIYINAFENCTGLTSVSFPNSLTSISEEAFKNTGLTRVDIPSSVQTIGQNAFINCPNLTLVYIASNAVASKEYSYGANTAGGNNNFCTRFGNQVKTYIFGSEVTAIGRNALHNCTGVTKVIFYGNLTTIGQSAFRCCTSLTSIQLPNTVTAINDSAFEGCLGLTSLNLPNSLTSISSWAFNGCTGLTSLNFPNSLTSIGDYAFSGCTGLTSLNFPNSLTSIGMYAFSSCTGLTTLKFPNSLTSIGMYAFSGCTNIQAMTVRAVEPPTATANTFENVPKNIPVYVPSGSIQAYKSATGWKDFYNISDDSYIVFADGTVQGICLQNWDTNNDGKLSYIEAEDITNIGTLFKGKIIHSFDELQYFTGLTSIPSNAFEGCAALTSITFPNSLTSIGGSAFKGCANLSSIVIPSSVTSINGSTFNGCTELAQIVVESGNTKYDSRNNCNAIIKTADNTLIAGCKTTVIPDDVTSIGGYAFYNCTGLTSIEIPNTVTYIGWYAFEGCTGLTSIQLPSSLTTIRERAFEGCTGLTSITIPNLVTTIGENAFLFCSGLTSLVIGSSVTTIGNYAFSGCSAIERITVLATTPPPMNNSTAFSSTPSSPPLYVPCGTSEAYQNATCWSGFKNIVEVCNIEFEDPLVKNICVANWDTNGDGELSMVEAEAVTDLNYQFYYKDITSFNELQYFTGLTSIINFQFYKCTSLTSITIPSSVTSIEVEAFEGCTGLAEIVVESGNTVYDSRNGCNAIIETATNTLIAGCKNTVIPSSVTSIGRYAFYGCTGLTSIEIPSSVTAIKYAAFSQCTGLTSVEIPQSITSIQFYAFEDCTGLESITVLATTPPTVGNYAFKNVPTDIPVYVPCSSRDAYIAAEGWNEFTNIGGDCYIEFEDQLVKEICVANWDTNDDDELSYAEAAAVVGLNSKFEANDQITSFDELQYFTGLTDIGAAEFINCTSLTSIILPPNITMITEYAFSGCSFTSITLPENLTYIDEGAFQGCTSLTSITFPEGLIKICCYAFDGTGLESISIPASVTEIELEAFFCSNLESIEVHPDNTIYTSNNGCNVIVEKATNKLIVGCANSDIYEGVQQIERYAFYNVTGTLTLPSTLQGIGAWAFYDCTNLASIRVNATTPPTLDTDAFKNVDKTIPVYVPCSCLAAYQSADGWNAFTNITEECYIVFEDQLVKNICVANWDTNGDEELSYAEAAAVSDLGTVFRDEQHITSFDELQYFTGLTAIGDEAFYNCVSLASITLPNTVTSIGNEAFWSCYSLTFIEIPSSVTSIGEIVFQGCNNLNTVTIGSSVNSIGNWVFADCTGLESITVLATTPPAVGDYAFTNVPTHIPVYVPCGSREAYQSATGWSNFTNIQEDCNITLTIAGYGDDPTTTEGWNLIASPLMYNVFPEDVENMKSNNYDLYAFDGLYEGAEWRNYKNNAVNEFNILSSGVGYLYANSETVTLIFKGEPLSVNSYVKELDAYDTKFGHWNLIGNSFTTEATVSVTDYYRIEPGTRTLILSSGNVNPMEGIFVEYNSTLDEVEFTKATRGSRAVESPMVNIDLRNAEGHLLDRARLRMGEGNNMSKLDMLSDPNRLYFRIDGKDYAVARVNGQGEMPLHFDAAQNGTFTLNVNVEGMEMAYLHLIDNMTGEDIDLLATSTGSVAKYTFTGKPSDYASRFRLVFETGSSAEGDSFAFIDAAGNIVITNAEAGATLQVIDVMGRVVVCRDASNASAISTSGMTAGVYVLRLINGDDVKVQKIVVD